MHDAGNERGDDRAQVGTQHPGQAEDQHTSPLDKARPQELHSACKGDRSHDKQGARDCDFFVLAEQVDEYRYSQD